MVENAARLIEGSSPRDVVLASEMKSRRKLLTAAGIAFRTVEPDVDEASIHEALLKDKGEMKLPEAYVFETGANRWRTFERWPPEGLAARTLHLRAAGWIS